MTDVVTATDRPTSAQTVPFEPFVGAELDYSAEPQHVRWAHAAFDAAAAWTTGWLDYTAATIQRGSTPLDVLGDAQRFWSAVVERPQPTWSTPFEVVKEWPAVRLLDFSTDAEAAVVPTLFLPPQAGHASTIVDYTSQQSQVRTALDQGLTRLFVLDWLGATPETAGTTIEDYIAVMDEVVEAVGGSVNLVGDCQGGWLATIYAALRPQSVASLSIGAAPIDFHAGQGALHPWISAQRSTDDPMRLYRSLVEANGGVHKGELQVTGFKMLEPAGELSRLADLWAHIGDEEYVDRYRDFVAWFETAQDMPGAFYLWTVEHLFVNNELVAGTLDVGGELVDLSRITMPIHLLAGNNDHITPPEQVWALAEHVSTPSHDIGSHLVESGHLGLFMGRQSLREHWAPLFREVSNRNAADAQRASAPTDPSTPAVKKSEPTAKVSAVKKSEPTTKTAAVKRPAATKAPAVKKSEPAKTPAVKKSEPTAKTAAVKRPAATKAAAVKKSEPATKTQTEAPVKPPVAEQSGANPAPQRS